MSQLPQKKLPILWTICRQGSVTHIVYINTKKYQEPEGEHFNSTGHTKADMKVLVLEKVYSCDSEYRKEQESHHIRKFNTYYRGLNKKP